MLRLRARHFKGAAAVALLLVAAAVPASAQGGPPPGMGRPEGVRGDPKRAEMDAQTRREAMLRTAGRPGSAAEVNPLQLAAAIEQTKNDFKRIQLLRNDIVASLLAKKPLDYRQLASEAEEINKRAGRLKSFLMKPAPEAEHKGEAKRPEAPAAEYDETAMKSALIKLCNTIYSFTESPMFKNLAVVDAGEPAKAGGDLLTIIELSESVKRNAERMSKSK